MTSVVANSATHTLFQPYGGYGTSSVSVVWPPTSPAPNSRGPLRSVFGRRLQLLPATPFFQTSLPSLGPKILRRASLRMPSDETLRVTLVCTLPLLHFSPVKVAVVQRFGVILRCRSVAASSSSAPAFRCARQLALMPHPVRVTSANSQLSRFLEPAYHRSSLFGFQWALGDSEVCSQPLKFFPKALATRAASPR